MSSKNSKCLKKPRRLEICLRRSHSSVARQNWRPTNGDREGRFQILPLLVNSEGTRQKTLNKITHLPQTIHCQLFLGNSTPADGPSGGLPARVHRVVLQRSPRRNAFAKLSLTRTGAQDRCYLKQVDKAQRWPEFAHVCATYGLVS